MFVYIEMYMRVGKKELIIFSTLYSVKLVVGYLQHFLKKYYVSYIFRKLYSRPKLFFDWILYKNGLRQFFWQKFMIKHKYVLQPRASLSSSWPQIRSDIFVFSFVLLSLVYIGFHPIMTCFPFKNYLPRSKSIKWKIILFLPILMYIFICIYIHMHICTFICYGHLPKLRDTTFALALLPPLNDIHKLALSCTHCFLAAPNLWHYLTFMSLPCYCQHAFNTTQPSPSAT